MKRVFICSPYSGDVNQNVLYARAAMRDALLRGEAPFVPHLLYTQPQVLNDSEPEERKIGTLAGQAYLTAAGIKTVEKNYYHLGCELLVVYYDRGISQGMMEDMEEASNAGIPIEFRSLKQSKDGLLWKHMSPDWKEVQERGLTTMWLDEQERVRAGE